MLMKCFRMVRNLSTNICQGQLWTQGIRWTFHVFILDVLLTRVVQIISIISDCDFNLVRCFLHANGADGNITVFRGV